MTVIPYLRFDGTCFDAMSFYTTVFETEIDSIMRASEMPDFEVPEAQKNLIAHMSIKVSGGEIYASDAFMDDAGPMAGCSVMVTMPDAKSGAAAFDRLGDGGTVTMPFQKTFWSPGFGTVVDKFGVKWMISTEEEGS